MEKNGLKTPGIYKPTNHTLLYKLVVINLINKNGLQVKVTEINTIMFLYPQ
jgi:hypothetical protein